MICERCFASVKHGSEFCPECGAPMGSSPAEGSDAAIYPELARANLLRMRGDFKAALAQCRTILHKFPNNVTANQLLGDLCAESGDLEQAKEWYELALDIAPNHPQITRKLNDIRQRLEHAETEGLVEQLGLPPSKPKNGLLALGVSVLVIGVCAVAYVLGTQKNKPTTSLGPSQHTQVKAPVLDNQPKNDPPSQETPSNETPANPAQATGANADIALAQLVAQRSPQGSKLLGLVVDPRTQLLTLTYRIDQGDDRRLVGTDLAAATFDNSPNTRLITLRGVENGEVVYAADARREAYEQTKADDWKQANGTDLAAIAKHILSQEWPAPTSTETGGTAETQPDVNNPGP